MNAPNAVRVTHKSSESGALFCYILPQLKKRGGEFEIQNSIVKKNISKMVYSYDFNKGYINVSV